SAINGQGVTATLRAAITRILDNLKNQVDTTLREEETPAVVDVATIEDAPPAVDTAPFEENPFAAPPPADDHGDDHEEALASARAMVASLESALEQARALVARLKT
ncbi:MAG TPA: hypothetical protein VM733_16850, partial [Thermoanaerobaculia bacterium]|nr:hypothetical protein [Thermoanaerobaculia bacterium]